MKYSVVILFLALAIGGCSTQSKTQLKEQNAYLAGENAELQREQAQQIQTVTVLGDVQTQTVPWVEGLTLAQAVATANYLDPKAPRKIILTRQGESAQLDGKVLLQGVPVPLEPGDAIELRP